MDITLHAKKRDTEVKPKHLRKDGWVPGCIYGKSMEPVNIQIPFKELKKCVKAHAAKVELTIDGGQKYLVGFEEVQKGHLGSELVHVSFHALNKNEKATLTVPFHFVGEAIGKKEGAEVGHQIHEINVTGYPNDIPDEITVDVTNLNVGDTVKVSDIAGNFKFEFAEDDMEKVIANCHHIKVQSVEPETTEVEPELVGEAETTEETVAETPTESEEKKAA